MITTTNLSAGPGEAQGTCGPVLQYADEPMSPILRLASRPWALAAKNPDETLSGGFIHSVLTHELS
jgi:hypothetical protein